ncbi:MAG: hypothetical protein ACR2QK_21330 [Acidimicrobiales bacterium]
MLFDPGLARAERIERLNGLGDVRDCIVAGLTATVETQDWARFEPWLFAAFLQPSTDMTELLSGVLSQLNPEVHNEDLVDVLAEIGDPRAIGAIEDALLWEPDWDEYHNLGLKCVWALGAIGTDEARSILEDTATVGPERIREHARHQIEQLEAADRNRCADVDE